MILSDLIIIAMTPSCGELFDFGKIQKLMFLIDEKVSPYAQWPRFDFKARMYGPADPKIYHIVEELRKQGLVIIPMNNRQDIYYGLSVRGQKRGEELFVLLDDKIKDSISQLSDFAVKYTFLEMEEAIYKDYPEMREHNLFLN